MNCSVCVHGDEGTCQPEQQCDSLMCFERSSVAQRKNHHGLVSFKCRSSPSLWFSHCSGTNSPAGMLVFSRQTQPEAADFMKQRTWWRTWCSLRTISGTSFVWKHTNSVHSIHDKDSVWWHVIPVRQCWSWRLQVFKSDVCKLSFVLWLVLN